MSNSPAISVRDAALNVMRDAGISRIFANPGSTEISLLSNFPEDLQFTLALHEGSVIGMATGLAIATGEPALAIVHTTAGLGNAIGAIATARVNRAPIAIIVGQQDRRHLATEPFLAGKLRGLAGEYPVWFNEPVTAQDVPAAIARAIYEARLRRGPAIVVVPMDDWSQLADPDHVFAAPARVERGTTVAPEVISQLAHRINLAKHPVIIAGAGNDSVEGWAEAVRLSEHLHVPVFQESFAGQAGFPQDHPNFAGFLSAARSVVRTQLAEFDLILALGAPVFRQYNFEAGPMFPEGTTVLLITEDTDEALRSPADISVIGSLPTSLKQLTEQTTSRDSRKALVVKRRPAPSAPLSGEPLRASHLMAALAERLSSHTIVVEETPSSRPDLHDLLPAREPQGFISAAMGGLGFGLPATIGLKMGAPERPVVAVLGDGSSMYGIQGLWSARHYNVGCLFIILNNNRYAVMDRLADKFGKGGPAWPAFDEIDFVQLSESLGVSATRISSYDQMITLLDEIIPTLTTRTSALTLVVDVEPELTFAP
ncbi:thiamine pyrophosphate-dependent enzyme [uncultured Aurantimicrobium sp.]|uniref:thiamine pyrophosphate-dependent enzyme n=1 Tax=uncultured Aurantimicrobium sp. TaxID=1705357 RepID=UPI00261756D7|nr:thiamine pyrophosphate-dependent enzyme [uncultured Aurantimicrobium sp.]